MEALVDRDHEVDLQLGQRLYGVVEQAGHRRLVDVVAGRELIGVVDEYDGAGALLAHELDDVD